jgi:hypothetical protein
MRTFVIALPLAVCAACILTAQTPAPPRQATASAPSSGKPLRHLQYKFSDDFEGVSEYHFNAIGDAFPSPYENVSGTSSGVGNVSASMGGRGTMDIDILSIAPDGALVVRISEWVENQPHPGQAYTCTVYGNTSVVCPPRPAPSDAEWVLLSYLGRQFVDAAPWDAQHHWQRKTDNPRYDLVEDFTMADGSDDKQAVIREKKKIQLHNGGFGGKTEEIVVTYDRAMEVPVAIHDEMQLVGSAGSGHGSYDFKLMSDSFAKPAQ